MTAKTQKKRRPLTRTFREQALMFILRRSERGRILYNIYSSSGVAKLDSMGVNGWNKANVSTIYSQWKLIGLLRPFQDSTPPKGAKYNMEPVDNLLLILYIVDTVFKKARRWSCDTPKYLGKTVTFQHNGVIVHTYMAKKLIPSHYRDRHHLLSSSGLSFPRYYWGFLTRPDHSYPHYSTVDLL